MTLDPFRYQTRGQVQAANERRYRRWLLRWRIRWSAVAVPPLTSGRTLRDMTLPIDPRDDQARIPQQATTAPPEPAAVDAGPHRRWRWIAAVVVVVLAIAGGVVYLLTPSAEDKATERCHAAVRDKLFSPSTAVFADKVQQNNTPPVYRVLGEVDAQNKAGATLRGEYICVLRLEDDGIWVTVDAMVMTR